MTLRKKLMSLALPVFMFVAMSHKAEARLISSVLDPINRAVSPFVPDSSDMREIGRFGSTIFVLATATWAIRELGWIGRHKNKPVIKDAGKLALAGLAIGTLLNR